MEKINLGTKPFDDEKLKYNQDERLYILELDYFQNKTGIELVNYFGDSKKQNIFLEKISQKVYDLIFDTTLVANRERDNETKQYLYACNHEIRTMIAKAIVAYGEAALQSSFDIIENEHGVNFETGVVIDTTKFPKMPAPCERILSKTNLMVGTYNFRPDDEIYKVGY